MLFCIRWIDDYTREAGVRELERMLAALCRKAVKELVSGTCKRVTITTKNLTTYLGHKKYLPDDQSKTRYRWDCQWSGMDIGRRCADAVGNIGTERKGHD